jgi:hypothetical protein
MTTLRLLSLAGLGAALAGAACAASDAVVECRAGADCASGVCASDGHCAQAATNDAGGVGGGTATGAGGGGGGTSAGGGSGTGGGGVGGDLGCSPNHDGVITRAEVPLAAGLHATFRTAKNAQVDTAGAEQPDGSRTWDLSKDLTGDQSLLVETQPLDGKWFAADFAGATYASFLPPDPFLGDMMGVFEVNGSALLLRGVVSPDGGATKTEETYSPGASLLAFPLKDGATWSTTSAITGTLKGMPTMYSEVYASTVDAHGKLATPFATFDVLRVKTTLTRTIGAIPTVTRSFLFVTECFGTVATITSQAGEPSEEFTTAAEVRRLAP